MSNLGHWSYNGTPFPYGSRASYQAGAEWLADCPTIDDWGCGAQWFREEMRGINPACSVRGIDGSPGCCDIVTDLATYRPEPVPDGIFMRHVLEHNHDWQAILDNALKSFAQKMFLVLFTPAADSVTLIYDFRFASGATCPVLSLPLAEIDAVIAKAGWAFERKTVDSPGTEFGTETLYRIEWAA